MKLNLVFPLLLACSLMAAERPHADPLDEYLFPPDLIMQNADVIKLTDEQRSELEAEMHKAQDRFTEMHADREKRLEAMAALLKKERIDESAALGQFEKVMEKEREIRRAHLTLVMALKNKLTAEQQAKLQEIKKRSARTDAADQRRPGKAPPPSLQEKMKKLKAGVQKLEDEGGDATSVGELMQDFKPLVDAQKFKQAEELLDQALKLLQEQKR